jgi:hypothetical protein
MAEIQISVPALTIKIILVILTVEIPSFAMDCLSIKFSSLMTKSFSQKDWPSLKREGSG